MTNTATEDVATDDGATDGANADNREIDDDDVVRRILRMAVGAAAGADESIARETKILHAAALTAVEHDPDTCPGTLLYPAGWCVGEQAASVIETIDAFANTKRALGLTLIMLGRYIQMQNRRTRAGQPADEES